MKILFIAPVFPPTSGQSKASKILFDALQKEHDVTLVDLNKENLQSGAVSFNRFLDIAKAAIKVYQHRKNNDIIYISLAESFAGNMRDILFYQILKKDIGKIFIHMLGGAGMKNILAGNSWQKKLNEKLMKKFAGVIVEGPANFETFKQVVPEDKIHIVPNFAEDFLFVTNAEIEKKFEKLSPIHILYLSNLINGKGYLELAEAYLSLDKGIQKEIEISFVGGFETNEHEKFFLDKIKNTSGIKYLGKYIDGAEKRQLYLDSHIFCLPTYYPFEGQPISILEAYATGCVVITTNHSGIPFVFKDQKNGYMVEKKSVESLAQTMQKIISEKQKLLPIAYNNQKEAIEKYRTTIFQNKIINIFKNNR